MTRPFEFPARVTDGRLPKPVGDKLAACLRTFEGKDVLVAVSERKRPRSLKQNKYWFGVVVRDITLALRELGNNIDEQETHDFLKDDVAKLKRAIILPTGEVKFTVPSSANLTTAEFTRLIDVSRVWALEELALDIPPPDPLYYLNTNQEGEQP